MSDLISRQAILKHIEKIRQDALMIDDIRESSNIMRGMNLLEKAVRNQPSAQPELPKQFMSDDCISRSELYKKVCEAEKLAQERVFDTRSDSPFPSKLNPAYIRYSAQLDERTQFKHMIADARSVQPEIVRCKDCAKREHCRTSTVWAVAPNDDWYCADAKRRTDE